MQKRHELLLVLPMPTIVSALVRHSANTTARAAIGSSVGVIMPLANSGQRITNDARGAHSLLQMMWSHRSRDASHFPLLLNIVKFSIFSQIFAHDTWTPCIYLHRIHTACSFPPHFHVPAHIRSAL